MGLRILPNSAALVYQTFWSDGTATMETGNFVRGHPLGNSPPKDGSLEQRVWRPDMAMVLRILAPLVETLECACRWADEPIPEKPRRKRAPRKRKPRRKPTRFVEI